MDPGRPCDPLSPGGPGGPTHTHVHAYTHKYDDAFRIFLCAKTMCNFLSMDEHCWKTETSMNMDMVTTSSRMLKIWHWKLSHSKCELHPSQGFVI